MDIDQITDKFIALANESAEQEQSISKVSQALRHAAARYDAFEASLNANDLEEEREATLKRLTYKYRSILIDNVDELIEKDKKSRPLN